MSGRIEVTDTWAKFPYVSCNFYNEEAGERKENVLDSYKIFTFGEEKIALIGITTPESFTKSTPAYFQDESGNYIYGISGGEGGKEVLLTQTGEYFDAIGMMVIKADGTIVTDLIEAEEITETVKNDAGEDEEKVIGYKLASDLYAGAVNVIDYVMEDYMVLATYIQAFEEGVVDATNSPLLAKYSGMLLDYGTTAGSERIVYQAAVR